MKKILILFFIFFPSNVLAHMDHYKKYKKIEMDIFRNGKLIGYNNRSSLSKNVSKNKENTESKMEL